MPKKEEKKVGVFTVADVVSSQDAFKKLSRISFPIKISYQISKVAKKVAEEVRSYELARFDLIKKYGKLVDKEKDTWQVKPEKNKDFQDELSKLDSFELEPFIDKKLKLEDLGDVSIAPEALVDWLFE